MVSDLIPWSYGARVGEQMTFTEPNTMNKTLKYILDNFEILSKRSLILYKGDIDIVYTTEYKMWTKLGPFTWYLTFRHPDCKDLNMLAYANMFKYEARAKKYMPGFAASRLPPENREDLDEILKYYNLEKYDLYELAVRSQCKSPIKSTLVRRTDPIDCPYESIFQIDKILEEAERE